jgi:hypothetical protein
MSKYTCTGYVRGNCGHKHRNLRTAAKCLGDDIVGCRKQGGYSDRIVLPLDGKPLTMDEIETVDRYIEE